MAWFREAKYILFIHMRLYSRPAGYEEESALPGIQ